MRILSILALVPLIMPAQLLAQCGTTYRARVSSYSYCAPYTTSTYTPYITPYVAPTTYSTQSYVVPYVAPVVKKEVVVEKVVVPAFNKYVAVIPIVEFPTYGAYYSGYGYGPQTAPNPNQPNPNPGQPQPQPQPTPPANGNNGNGASNDLRQILDIMKGLDERLKRLEDKDKGTGKAKPDDPFNPKPEQKKDDKDTSAQPQVKLPDVKEINAKKCAICHQAGNEAAGNDFVLSDKDGNIVKLTATQRESLSEHVYSGTMPKLNKKAKEAGITPLTDAEAGAWMQEIARQRKSSVDYKNKQSY